MKKLLLATANPHKILEMRNILKDMPYEVMSIDDLDINIIMPDETGNTFKDNAYIKAREVYRQIHQKYSDIWVLADDSGLSVDAIGGKPGVYSARYKGLTKSEDRLRAILEELKDIPWERRRAHFTTVMCLITEFAEVFTEGIVNGYITFKPRGHNGFGYDPIFYYPPLGKTYAEMTAYEKNTVSHRGLAVSKMKIILSALAKELV